MNRLPEHDSDDADGWKDKMADYMGLIDDDKLADSKYLREEGLIKTILKLIGRPEEPVLDVGCGDGWLFDRLQIKNGLECDIVSHSSRSGRVVSVQDVQNLSLDDSSFSLVIASMVLMWVENLQSACDELYRVTRDSGRTIIALTHPYFYRTGTVTETGQFLIDKDLSKPFIIDNHCIAEKVGPFKYFYRPITFYLNTLIASGWTVRCVKDWHIDMNDYIEKVNSDASKIKRTNVVPLYTFIECIKL